VERLARSWHTYGSQFAVFSEAPQLSDKSINQFLDTAEALTRLHEPALRADAGGTFQALVSLWQILVRQQTIADRNADEPSPELPRVSPMCIPPAICSTPAIAASNRCSMRRRSPPIRPPDPRNGWPDC